MYLLSVPQWPAMNFFHGPRAVLSILKKTCRRLDHVSPRWGYTAHHTLHLKHGDCAVYLTLQYMTLQYMKASLFVEE
jgi:hypothetical protein